MKCKYKGFSFYGRTQSLPVRGAWIEIKSIIVQPKTKAGSLPVRGAWIEMPIMSRQYIAILGRSPCGERGLK